MGFSPEMVRHIHHKAMTEKLKLPHAKLMVLATGAGLLLAEEKPKLLLYQIYLVFRRP